VSLVLAVAGIALAIGIAAGLLFIKRADPRLRPLPQAAPPAREASLPRAHPKTVPERAPSAREESVPAPSGAKPSVREATPGSAGLPSGKLAPAAATAGANAPDAGWVKPAWAIPDEEPRRVHELDARDAGR